ncbi:hypothetical protein AMAG_08375 [Allomyces macrogynus ATCC 38327]|uniref:Uncharacterized protein n=1 Tax=Allomyces macrogynus (strain ATCC 38327) TaxID=578462 RepID=A0A0L0SKY1_ALLM3|nr:hypothetical protein AMAG_08375 [Allomyces macrogynus ATCC 38327]|eukprot:KNE63226.1 hypothetical protein AMAG_08375 [Allomyces macrogynus ATCC 38327]
MPAIIKVERAPLAPLVQGSLPPLSHLYPPVSFVVSGVDAELMHRRHWIDAATFVLRRTTARITSSRTHPAGLWPAPAVRVSVIRLRSRQKEDEIIMPVFAALHYFFSTVARDLTLALAPLAIAEPARLARYRLPHPTKPPTRVHEVPMPFTKLAKQYEHDQRHAARAANAAAYPSVRAAMDAITAGLDAAAAAVAKAARHAKRAAKREAAAKAEAARGTRIAAMRVAAARKKYLPSATTARPNVRTVLHAAPVVGVAAAARVATTVAAAPTATESALAVEVAPSMEAAPSMDASPAPIAPYQIRLAEGVSFADLLRGAAAAHACTDVPRLGKRPYDALMPESRNLDQVLQAAVTGAPMPNQFVVLEHVQTKRQCHWKPFSDADVIRGWHANESLRHVELPGFAYRESPRAWHPFSGAVGGRWIVKYKPVDVSAAVAAVRDAGQ